MGKTGGMPLTRLEIKGAKKPTISPLKGPHIMPASKTGRCMGENWEPSPTAWNKSGNSTPSARNMAEVETFKALLALTNFIFISKLRRKE